MWHVLFKENNEIKKDSTSQKKWKRSFYFRRCSYGPKFRKYRNPAPELQAEVGKPWNQHSIVEVFRFSTSLVAENEIGIVAELSVVCPTV